MANPNRKRISLLSIADRLLVENYIKKSGENDLENGSDDRPSPSVINSALLEDPKNNLFTVQPGLTTKVRKRVYMLRRSKTTEGGTQVCELCGHMSFKLFATSVDVVEDGIRANQLRKKDSEVVRVCRMCFIKHNGGHATAISTNEQKKIRPIFEHHPCGLASDRASNSWHFVRRDIVGNKARLLLNHNCNERIYQEEIVSDISDAESSSDETSYEDDQEIFGVQDTGLLPFQKKDKLDTNCIKGKKICKDSLPKDGLVSGPVNSMGDGKDLKRNAEKSLTLNGANVLCQSNMPNISSDRDEKGNKKIENTLIEDEYIEVEYTDNDSKGFNERLLENINDELPILLDPLHSSEDELLKKCIASRTPNDDVYFCFNDKECRARILRSAADRKKDKIMFETEDRCTTGYEGVCKIVTIISQNRGHYVESSDRSSVYDRKGYSWRKQDLPRYVGINTKQYRKKKRARMHKNKSLDQFLFSKHHRRGLKTIGALFSKTTTAINQVYQQRETEKESEVTQVRKPGGTCICMVCNAQVHKSYSVFDKENAPLRLLKYFPSFARTIRVCRKCAPYSKLDGDKNSTTKKLNTDKGEVTKKLKMEEENRKRGRSTEDENDTESELDIKVLKQENKRKQANPKSSFVTTSTSKKVVHLKNDTKNKEECRDHGKSPVMMKATEEIPSTSSNTKKSVNLKVMQNPNVGQLKKLSENSKTKYVIVQATSTSGGSTIQKLSTVASDGGAVGKFGDITINGKRYKIDNEFKLNDLVKDNENAGLSSDPHKDIIAQLPSILKRTIGNRTGGPTKYKIVNVVHGNQASSMVSNSNGILADRNLSIGSSVPSARRRTFTVSSPIHNNLNHQGTILEKRNQSVENGKDALLLGCNQPTTTTDSTLNKIGKEQSITRQIQQLNVSRAIVPSAHNLVIKQGSLTVLPMSTVNQQAISASTGVASLASHSSKQLAPMHSTNQLLTRPSLSATSPLNSPLTQKPYGVATQIQIQPSGGNVPVNVSSLRAGQLYTVTTTGPTGNKVLNNLIPFK